MRRALIGSGGLHLAQDGERLVRCDLGDRNAADDGIGLGEEPADLLDRDRREVIPLAFDEPFLGYRLKRVGRGIFGGDPRPLFLQCGIDASCDLLLRLVAPDASIGEAYLGPPAEMECLLLVEEPILEAP
jgi:hypothetical protein